MQAIIKLQVLIVYGCFDKTWLASQANVCKSFMETDEVSWFCQVINSRCVKAWSFGGKQKIWLTILHECKEEGFSMGFRINTVEHLPSWLPGLDRPFGFSEVWNPDHRW